MGCFPFDELSVLFISQPGFFQSALFLFQGFQSAYAKQQHILVTPRRVSVFSMVILKPSSYPLYVIPTPTIPLARVIRENYQPVVHAHNICQSACIISMVRSSPANSVTSNEMEDTGSAGIKSGERAICRCVGKCWQGGGNGDR